MLRTIQPGELIQLRELGGAFYREAKLPGRFRYGVFASTWRRLLATGMGVILTWWPPSSPDPLGALGAAVYPDPNDGEPVATEFFWFMAPQARGGLAAVRLLKAFEAWAAAAGARRVLIVHLSHLNAEPLARLYHRLGYREIETHYLKEI